MSLALRAGDLAVHHDECLRVHVVVERILFLRSQQRRMSWWLSTPIRRLLHKQTEHLEDGNQNTSGLEAVWNVLKETPACAASTRQ